MNQKQFDGGVNVITYIHISSLSPQTRYSTTQEYYSLHCSCRILPAPLVRVVDEVCYAEFLLSPAANDKCLRFRC